MWVNVFSSYVPREVIGPDIKRTKEMYAVWEMRPQASCRRIYVSLCCWVIIIAGNSLPPVKQQAIISTEADLLQAGH